MAQDNSNYTNPYSTYQPPREGSAMGFSTPGTDFGDQSGAEVVEGFISGRHAFDDLTAANAPVYNTWTPETYEANPESFQLGDAWQQEYQQRASSVANRRATPAVAARVGEASTYGGAMINTAPQAEYRGAQSALVQALQRRAAGQTPSAAEIQLRQGQENAVRQARALAASNASLSPALAQQQANAAIGQINADANNQAAMLRAQEQAQAERDLAQTLAGARGQDLGLAGQQAGFQQQAGLANTAAANQFALQQSQFNQDTGLANQQARLQQTQLNDQMVQFYEQQGYNRDQAQLLASMQMEELNAQQQQQYNEIMSQLTEANVNREAASQGGALGMVGNIVGGLVASDEDLKEDIDDLDEEDIDDFMRSVEPVSYDYKDFDYLPEGRQYGFIAQDIERSAIGKSLVKETPQGKAIDTVRGFGAVLAALRRLDDRLQDVEGAAA